MFSSNPVVEQRRRRYFVEIFLGSIGGPAAILAKDNILKVEVVDLVGKKHLCQI
jgi:hypothetical protein